MSYIILYHTDAMQDIISAQHWYKEQLSDLDKKFASAIKQTIKHISSNPLLFEIRYRNIRIAYTPIFPYGIHYTIDTDNNTVVILAVMHTSRKT